MIGTLRRHSKWLWLVIIFATVVSFVYWGANTSRLGSGAGGRQGDLGTINGERVTVDTYASAGQLSVSLDAETTREADGLRCRA